MSARHPLHEKKAVLFDAGFTLLEPVAPIPEIYLEHALELGVSPARHDFHAAFYSAWAGVGGRAFRPDHRTSDAEEHAAWHTLTAEVARPFPDLGARHQEWYEKLMARFDASATWKPVTGAHDLLAGLRRRGLRLAIVSNWHSALPPILRDHGLLDYFDAVLCSGTEGYRKPHPELFRRALHRLSIEPEACIHVGDSHEDDVLGARRAGIDAWHLSPAQKPGPHATVPSLVDLLAQWTLKGEESPPA